MSDNTKQEKVVEKAVAKKEPWTVKRVLTTIIIAILALLMIGGVYYVVVMVQQSKDTTNVFGYYDGEPIKLAYNTVFYNTLMSNENYMTAATTGDYNTLYSCYSSAFQAEVVYRALSAMAKEAGIPAPEKIVDQLVIESGQFAGENGETFDPGVYKNASISAKNAATNYYTMMYPYQEVGNDLYSTLTSEEEKNFVTKLSENTIDLSYFVINYNVYSDELASEYDISEMEKTTDENGNEVEPTMSQIKAYIASKEPEKVQQVIDEKLILANEALSDGFEAAAKAAGCDIYALAGVTNNLHGSGYFYGIEQVDANAGLAPVVDEALTKTLFTEKDGYFAGPFTAEDGSYVFVRLDSSDSESNYSSLTNLIYQYYSAQHPFLDAAQNTFASDKFEDNFMTAFWTMLFGNMVAN